MRTVCAAAFVPATARELGEEHLKNLADRLSKQLERLMTNQARLALASAGMGGVDALIDECLLCTYDQLLRAHGGPRWDEAGFAALRDLVRADVFDAASAVLTAAARAIATAGSSGYPAFPFSAAQHTTTPLIVTEIALVMA